VAEHFAAMISSARVTFCGSGKSFERRYVTQAGFEYLALPSRPLPHGAREAVAFVVENVAGYLAAGRFLRDERVAAVVGLGGYASVSMARAAARRHVPLVLLEQNVIPGRATRWLARRATLICTAFDATFDKLRCRCPVRVTGNPVRGGFHRRPTEPAAQRQLVILGGSGGAHALNASIPAALYKVRDQLQGWRVVHQSGEAGLAETWTLYGKLGLDVAVVPFLLNMPGVLAATDLVVCRAGGTTLAELAVAGTPAVLLPYPHATDDHQLANAQLFVAGGGCAAIDERTVSGPLEDPVAEILARLLTDSPLRQRMSAAMHALARPNAADDVVALLWSIVSSRAYRAELAVA
jgi:UDP-N-acetylglucosamine--N-acetylmuramyl-(pentapeptide) pyrophosphoryl-undecaprenol N-acetylglucosamine transferase